MFGDVAEEKKSSQKVINVLFVITGLSTGGAEVMLRRLVERIDRTRFVCRVISLTDIGEIGDRMSDSGIEIEALGLRPTFFLPIHLFRLVRRIRQIKPDLVHTWMYHADLFGGIAARLAGFRSVIWGVRSADFLRAETRLLTKIVLYLCARLSHLVPLCVVYNSESGEAYHRKLGYSESRHYVIPNGVDMSVFSPNEEARAKLRQELGVPVGTVLVGLVARFDPLKNHEGFIRAASYLHLEMPSVNFLMIGRDVDWTNPVLKTWIERAGLTSVFHLLGRRVDTPYLMAALDVVSLTSWSEAFPNVLIEAMSCGVPSVSTDVGDAAFIIGDVNWVVSTGDMRGIVDRWLKLLRLSLSERLDIGEKFRARVREKFELDYVVKRYESVYVEIIEGMT